MSETLKGGIADNKSLNDLVQKHAYDDSTDSTSKEKIKKMLNHLKKQLEIGKRVESEHTNDVKKSTEIAMDHLSEDPNYYTKLKKAEVDEQTMADSSGAFDSNAFNPIVKRKIRKISNFKLSENQEMEFNEAMDASSSGSYDVPLFGSTPKGRKNPLKIDGPDSIYKGKAVKDKNFPKWGGPDSVFVKVKEKCKKFPYCNQGNTGAIEFIHENEEIKDAIKEASKKLGIPYKEIEKIVLNEIKDIFI
jgi:hypothetical protein